MLTWALVTKETKAEPCIRPLAPIDTLTGLADRVTIQDDLQQRTAVPGTPSSLFHLDLDRFQRINDTGGYRLGDELPHDVADRPHRLCADHGRAIGRPRSDGFAVQQRVR